MPDRPASSQPLYLAARPGGFLLAGLFVLGAALRIWHLDARPLWVDEAFSVLYGTIDWSEVIELRRAGTNPPLYHLLLSGWVALFGPSVAAIRSLSVLFGLASLPLLYALARRLAGRYVALVAAGLLAVSNLSVAYAREARFYALTQMLALVASLLLCRLIDRTRRRDAAWYALSASALVWVHTYGWFVLAAQVLWLAAAVRDIPPDDQRRRRLALLGIWSVGAVVLSFVPWLPVLYQQVSTVLRDYWIPEPDWVRLAVCFRSILVLDRWLLWPLIGMLGAGLLVKLLDRLGALPGRAAGPATRPPAGLPPMRPCHRWGLTAWLTLPILIPFLWSKLCTPIFQVKYAIVAQAPALILFAALLARRPLVGLGVLAALTGIWAPNADRDLVVEDFPGATRVLLEQTDERDTIFVYKDYACFALDYYLQGQRKIIPVLPEGQMTSSFAPYYRSPAITYDQMMGQLADAPARDCWLVLRWGSVRQRRELLSRVTQYRAVESIWPLRAVDVLRLRRR